MRVSWRTPDQNAFIERRLPSYNQHSAAKTLKAGFWPGLISQWFERWPLPEPTPAAIEKCEGSIERARKVARRKKINVSTTRVGHVGLNLLHLCSNSNVSSKRLGTTALQAAGGISTWMAPLLGDGRNSRSICPSFTIRESDKPSSRGGPLPTFQIWISAAVRRTFRRTKSTPRTVSCSRIPRYPFVSRPTSPRSYTKQRRKRSRQRSNQNARRARRLPTQRSTTPTRRGGWNLFERIRSKPLVSRYASFANTYTGTFPR